jgi:RimJ/RimL family protein N-acetyltransferase
MMSNRLYLRAFEYEDLKFLNMLRNDDSFFALTTGNKYYISSERDKKWIEDKIFNNYNQLYLMLCTIEGNQPIGYICATNIDYINRKAQLGGIAITPEFAGAGYGTEGTQLLLRHLFGEMGLNKVYVFSLEEHAATLRIAEKTGFQKVGLVRDYVYKQNRFHNAYLLEILRADYEQRINEE